MPVSFQREQYAHAVDEIRPLAARHSAEVQSHGHALRLNDAMYHALEKAGALWLFTARSAQGLIGYSAYIVSPSMHYEQVLQATNDSVYVAPSYRSTGTGTGLINHAEHELEAGGVGIIYQTVKAAHDWSKVLQRRGYTLDEVVFCKHLEPATAAVN